MENTKDRSNGRVGPSVIGREMPQMFASAKLAIVVNRVKPERPRQRGIESAESRQDKLRRWVGCNYKPDDLNRCNRRVRTRMPGGVGGAEPSGSPLSRSLSGSPTWARTRDLRINSPALYLLSYRGMKLQIIA